MSGFPLWRRKIFLGSIALAAALLLPLPVWAQPEVGDFYFDAAKSRYVGYVAVNKFGRNPVIDTATDPEDVWDAGGVWVAPTVARVHNLVSGSGDDAAAGTGMRTVQVYGLTDWDTAEVWEIVTLDGASTVATINSYVIIHRMKGLSFGSGGTNAGAVTATAVTDATVTASITAGKGQSLMAIYGLSSGEDFYATGWYLGMNRTAASAASADVDFLVMENADLTDSGFVVKHHLGLASAGSSHISHKWTPPLKITGPAIIKIQIENVSANGTDISSGFDGVLAGAN